MNATAHGESFILTQFCDFYRELIRLKQLVQAGAWTYPADPTRAQHGNPPPAINAVWQPCSQIRAHLNWG